MSQEKRLDRAVEQHRAGRLDEAAALYQEILRAEPDHADALHLLGTIAYQRGDDAQAVALIGRALARDDRPAVMHNHLGLALLRQEKLDEATDRFRRAIARDPGLASAHANLARARQRQGRWEEARDALKQALMLDPSSPAYPSQVVEQGEALLGLGKAGEALTLCKDALAIVPQNTPILRTLADALHAQNDRVGAIAAYQEVLALDPSDLAAWWGLGCAQSARGEWTDAASSFQQALILHPEFGEAAHNLGKALFELGQIDEAVAAYRKAAAIVPAREMPLGMIATIIPGSPAADHQAVLDARRDWGERIKPAERPVLERDRSDRPIRLGYVSAFFGKRNWMKPVWGLINRHDRDRFAIHLFSDGPEPDPQSGYRPDPRDRFHDISGQGNIDVARLIEAEGIDVLVDLNGYSKLPRLPLFALRPAPVLVAWFNQFATTGLDSFDALIGDAHVIPEAEEAYYTEPIVRVPGSYLTFEVAYPVPEIVEPPSLSRGFLTFGSLAPQYKITPEVLAAWARILRESPGARLLLKSVALGSARNRDFVIEQFVRQGIGPDRLELEGPDEHFAFLTRYAAIDLTLDTFPYNGGTSTMESLWQGVPVLTFDGDRWVSRISASLMREAGLAEYVAPDREGYIARAVALASDPETPTRLASLRRTMRDRLGKASVCDCERLTRDIEAIYQRLWDGRD
jgi:predicted O-linked N-acetylglucosamine transferase (SPINDLY family)